MVKKKNIIKNIVLVITVLVLMALIVYFVGRSYGFFQYVKKGETTNVITIKGIRVDIIEDDNALNLENAEPLYDSDGMQLKAFTFSITNTSKRPLSYTMKVVNDTDKQSACLINEGTAQEGPCPVLTTDNIRYSYKLNNESWNEAANLGANNDVITTYTINANETLTYSIRMWIKSDATNDIMNHYFFGQLLIQGTQAGTARCDLQIGDTFTFDYNGTDGTDGTTQTFTASCDGKYKLETWGAQGGGADSTYTGGYGAYAVGNINLAKNENLYINVGGTGNQITGNVVNTAGGGYNGGGGSFSYWSPTVDTEIRGFGGGATSITIGNNRGVLKNYIDNQSEVLMVAAGGSGAQKYNKDVDIYSYLNGANGGGITGNIENFSGSYSSNASDTTGYSVRHVKDSTTDVVAASNIVAGSLKYENTTYSASFGQGFSGYGGGGGGYYGGIDLFGVTGGGSSYIGNSLLINKKMVCNNCTTSIDTATYTESNTCASETPTVDCAKKGNGYAKITYLGNE